MSEEIKNENINEGQATNNTANNVTNSGAEKSDDDLLVKPEKEQTIDELENQIENLKQKLEKAEKDRDEYLAGWQRARADFSNYRKDEAERFKEFIQYSNEGLIKDLIPVLDSFDLAIETLEKSGPVDKGIYMIRTKLEDVLKDYGLTRINIEVGKPFDPSIEEAILQVESDEGAGNVLEEIEAGYKLNDKVIRPVRVKVAVSPKK